MACVVKVYRIFLYSRNIERTALQEEHVAAFLRAYFGPISLIGARENSPEIVVIMVAKTAKPQMPSLPSPHHSSGTSQNTSKRNFEKIPTTA